MHSLNYLKSRSALGWWHAAIPDHLILIVAALSVTIIRHVWLLRSHTTPPANQLFLQDIPYRWDSKDEHTCTKAHTLNLGTLRPRVLRACLIIFPTVYSNPLSVVFQIGHDFETCYNIVTQGPRLVSSRRTSFSGVQSSDSEIEANLKRHPMKQYLWPILSISQL